MERSFALGLQFVAMRLFAYIPSPIFFGQAIDSACLLWSVKCDRNGSCLLYDIVMFRYKYVGIAAGLKVISLCFFVALWYFIRRRTIAEKEAEERGLPRSNSSLSVDRTDQDPSVPHVDGPPRPCQLPVPVSASPARNAQIPGPVTSSVESGQEGEVLSLYPKITSSSINNIPNEESIV